MNGRRRAWRQGLIQLLVAIALLLAVAHWGAAVFGGRADDATAELERRQGS